MFFALFGHIQQELHHKFYTGAPLIDVTPGLAGNPTQNPSTQKEGFPALASQGKVF
jgi:hypothetical protein